MVRARLARHPVRNPGGNGRQRRARQESPRRRLLRPARSQPEAAAGRRPDRGMFGGPRAGIVLGNCRRDGAHRAYPRSGIPHAANPLALDLEPEPADRRPGCDDCRAERCRRAVAHDRRLGRLPGAGTRLGTGDTNDGSLGGSRRSSPQTSAPTTPPSHPLSIPRLGPGTLEHEGVQLPLLLEARPLRQAGHRASGVLLLSAGRAGRLELDLRPPRLHPVSMRVAARRGQRPGAAVPGSVHHRGRNVVSVRDQGLRRGR